MTKDTNKDEGKWCHYSGMPSPNAYAKDRPTCSVEVRFPNESVWDTIPNFKPSEFKAERIFDDEVFGYYKATYIAIKRQDYEKIK